MPIYLKIDFVNFNQSKSVFLLHVVSLKFQVEVLMVARTSRYLFSTARMMLVSVCLIYHPLPYGVNRLMFTLADWMVFQRSLQMEL